MKYLARDVVVVVGGACVKSTYMYTLFLSQYISTLQHYTCTCTCIHVHVAPSGSVPESLKLILVNSYLKVYQIRT